MTQGQDQAIKLHIFSHCLLLTVALPALFLAILKIQNDIIQTVCHNGVEVVDLCLALDSCLTATQNKYLRASWFQLLNLGISKVTLGINHGVGK